jgi:hypothetical protein
VNSCNRPSVIKFVFNEVLHIKRALVNEMHIHVIYNAFCIKP